MPDSRVEQDEECVLNGTPHARTDRQTGKEEEKGMAEMKRNEGTRGKSEGKRKGLERFNVGGGVKRMEGKGKKQEGE